MTLMDQIYIHQKLVQLVCYQINHQNDLGLIEKTGIYSFLSPINSNLLFSIHTRSTEQFVQNNEIQLNEEELRQIEMRSYDTTINSPINNTQTNTTVTSLPIVPNEKLIKTDQRNDGTVSDSVLSSSSDTTKKRRPSKQSKAFVILGLSKKANSASNFGSGKSFRIKI